MRKLFAAAAVLTLVPVPAQAQGFAISGHIGSTGLGGGVIVGLAPEVNLRGMFGLIPGDPALEIEGIDWALDLPTFTLLVADFYPMSGFHLSAGGLIISDGGDLGVTGTFEDRTAEFNGNNYTGSDGDELVGQFLLKTFQPYAGIGFGNGIGKLVGMNLDVGLGFGEKPTVTVTPRGPLADDPVDGTQYRADVAAELSDIEDAMPEYFRFYPVVSLSVSIGF